MSARLAEPAGPEPRPSNAAAAGLSAGSSRSFGAFGSPGGSGGCVGSSCFRTEPSPGSSGRFCPSPNWGGTLGRFGGGDVGTRCPGADVSFCDLSSARAAHGAPPASGVERLWQWPGEPRGAGAAGAGTGAGGAGAEAAFADRLPPEPRQPLRDASPKDRRAEEELENVEELLAPLRSELSGLRGLLAECRADCEDRCAQLELRLEQGDLWAQAAGERRELSPEAEAAPGALAALRESLRHLEGRVAGLSAECELRAAGPRKGALAPGHVAEREQSTCQGASGSSCGAPEREEDLRSLRARLDAVELLTRASPEVLELAPRVASLVESLRSVAPQVMAHEQALRNLAEQVADISKVLGTPTTAAASTTRASLAPEGSCGTPSGSQEYAGLLAGRFEAFAHRGGALVRQLSCIEPRFLLILEDLRGLAATQEDQAHVMEQQAQTLDSLRVHLAGVEQEVVAVNSRLGVWMDCIRERQSTRGLWLSD